MPAATAPAMAVPSVNGAPAAWAPQTTSPAEATPMPQCSGPFTQLPPSLVQHCQQRTTYSSPMTPDDQLLPPCAPPDSCASVRSDFADTCFPVIARSQCQRDRYGARPVASKRVPTCLRMFCHPGSCRPHATGHSYNSTCSSASHPAASSASNTPSNSILGGTTTTNPSRPRVNRTRYTFSVI